MANRSRVLKRKPREHQRKEKCISYFADDPDNAEFFEPKKKPSRKTIVERKGKMIVNIKERALM